MSLDIKDCFDRNYRICNLSDNFETENEDVLEYALKITVEGQLLSLTMLIIRHYVILHINMGLALFEKSGKTYLYSLTRKIFIVKMKIRVRLKLYFI